MQQPQIKPSDLKDVQCEKEGCGNGFFEPVYMIKRVPGLLTGTGKDSFVPVQLFACTECGTVLKELLKSAMGNSTGIE